MYKIKCYNSEGKQETKRANGYVSAVNIARQMANENHRTSFIYSETFEGLKLTAKIAPNTEHLT